VVKVHVRAAPFDEDDVAPDAVMASDPLTDGDGAAPGFVH
jgi:hypothetical protein